MSRRCEATGRRCWIAAPCCAAGPPRRWPRRSACSARRPFRFARRRPAIDFSEFPICRTASDAPPLTGAPRKLKLSWNAGAVCLVPVPVAIDHGFFQKRNLDVEFINFGGSTDQLLEAIATGKADAGVGMALRWLKPLEQGFDVKITAGIHGGCMRLIRRRPAASCDPRARRGVPTSAGPAGTSSPSCWPSGGSIPTGTSTGGNIPAMCCRWRSRRARRRLPGRAIRCLDWLKERACEIATNLDGEYGPHLLHPRHPRQPGARRARGRRALTQALLDAGILIAESEVGCRGVPALRPKAATSRIWWR